MESLGFDFYTSQQSGITVKSLTIGMRFQNLLINWIHPVCFTLQLNHIMQPKTFTITVANNNKSDEKIQQTQSPNIHESANSFRSNKLLKFWNNETKFSEITKY